MPSAHPPRGLTLLEVVIAFSLLTLGLLAIIATAQTAILRSDVNREVKIAVFDVQSVIEQIAGSPFEEICVPQYSPAGPRYPQGKYYINPALLTNGLDEDGDGMADNGLAEGYAFLPIPGTLPADSHYQMGTSGSSSPSYSPFHPAGNTFMNLNLYDAEPRTKQKLYILYFASAAEQLRFSQQYRDRNLDPQRSDYVALTPAPWLPYKTGVGTLHSLEVPPDPLYVTVRCHWTGVRGDEQEMDFELPFMVTHMIGD